jgi:ferrochelatase
MREAVVLVVHGTVDELEDLPEFLRNIRRGHPAPPELIAEVRRRYEAIGGRSPLNAITREVAAKVQSRLSVPTRMAGRLFRPYPTDVVRELAEAGVERIVSVPMAQHSAAIYAEAMTAAAREHGLSIANAPNWGREPSLTRAYADALACTLAGVPEHERNKTTVILSAHSLPVAVVRGGDPYEDEVRASAAAIADAVGEGMPRWTVVFQSQGMSAGPGGRPIEWLGPGLEAALDEAKSRGDRHVVVAPVGFLADHVEILYDIDIEARAWAEARGLTLHRTPSLNAGERLVETIATVAGRLLSRPQSGATEGEGGLSHAGS